MGLLQPHERHRHRDGQAALTDAGESWLAALLRSSAAAGSRLDLWAGFVADRALEELLEVGVWRGEFAAHLLRRCPAIRRYGLLDPWRHLPDWNKPSSLGDAEMAAVRRAALENTAFAAGRREVLQGTTLEMAPRLADASLDFVYLDGDHGLRGILQDLLALWPKLRPGAFLAGDDLFLDPWHHGPGYEPTLVWPLVHHFAEAVGATLVALPFRQYLLRRPPTAGEAGAFRFLDTTGLYGDRSLARLRPSPP